MVLVAPSMKPDAPAFEANSLRLKATPALLREAYLGAETHRRGDAFRVRRHQIIVKSLKDLVRPRGIEPLLPP
jgi:hypothetical protein